MKYFTHFIICHYPDIRADINLAKECFDLVGPLPPSKGKTHVLTIIDRFSRRQKQFLSQTQVLQISPHSSSAIGWHDLVVQIKLPLTMELNQGSISFTLPTVRGRPSKTTPYHRASNAMIERFHLSMQDSFRAQNGKEGLKAYPGTSLGTELQLKATLVIHQLNYCLVHNCGDQESSLLRQTCLQ